MDSSFSTCLTAGYPSTKIDGRTTYAHIRVAEKALGRPLPVGAIVHHHDENKLNYEESNLVICQNRAYRNQFVCSFCDTCFDAYDVEAHECPNFIEFGELQRYDFHGQYMAGYKSRNGNFQSTKYVREALEVVRDCLPKLFEQNDPLFPRGRRS